MNNTTAVTPNFPEKLEKNTQNLPPYFHPMKKVISKIDRDRDRIRKLKRLGFLDGSIEPKE